MEVVPAVVGPSLALKPSVMIATYMQKYAERRDLVRDNKSMLHDLLRMYEDTLEVINKTENNRWHDIYSFDTVIKQRIGEYKERLEANLQDLKSLTERVEHALYIGRVKRMQRVLEDYDAFITEVREYYESIVRLALGMEGERATDVNSLDRDQYVACSNVPPNPPRLTLDYNNPDTNEGTLKAAIESSVHSTSRIDIVMVFGMGGVGKTCALRGLAYDVNIGMAFPDGILYIQLGNDSIISNIIAGIAECVEDTGGTQFCRRIREARTVGEASDKAREWFEGRKCLFLVDDIWEANGITPLELKQLGRMLNDESLLVFTSRSVRFMEGADTDVHFRPLHVHGELAQRMLMKHAGIESYVDLRSANRKAVKGILERCKGLPLTLGIAGAAMWRYFDSGVDYQDVLSKYYDDLKSKEENIVAGRAELYDPPLRLIVDKSLKVLDTESRFEKSFKEMFQGFCVLQKHQSVSGHVLQGLWNLDDLGSTRMIAALFERESLIKMRLMGGDEFSVQVHDLILDIAKEMASGGRMTEWFKALLKRYAPKERTRTTGSEIEASNEESVMFTPWWEVEDDGFIQDNLCRVLQEANETEELVWLLERAQWIVMRLQKCGIRGVEQDLAIGLQVAERNGAGDAELIRYLRLIGNAAGMSSKYLVETTYEAWFQIYGRMIWYAEHCERTRRFTCEIEEHAPRPWIKPSIAMLDDAAGVFQDVSRREENFDILDICHKGDVTSTLWTNRDTVCSVTKCNRTTNEITPHPLHSDRNSSSKKPPMSHGSTCGAFSGNLKKLVTGHRDGHMVVWDIDSGYKADRRLECAGTVRRLFRWACVSSGGYGIEEPTCVAISGDGSTVVCGSEYGHVRYWDISNQEAVRNVFRTPRAHKRVIDLDVSFDGTRIVYCSGKSTIGGIRVWDKAVGKVKKPLPEMQCNSVTCVAISRDGKQVVSGLENGKIQIWNIDANRVVYGTEGHYSWGVRLVAFSPDGRRIVSCASEDMVRVWDAENGKSIAQCVVGGKVGALSANFEDEREEVLTAESGGRICRYNILGPVCSIAYRGDGTEIVSGCEDGCVRVWNNKSGKRIGEPLQCYESEVNYVAVSADGKRIVSASQGGSVGVWDADSGEAVAAPLSQIEEHPLRWIGSVAFVNVNDGSRVVFSCAEGVCVWDIDKDKKTNVTQVTSDAWWYTRVAICADGARIAGSSWDHVIVWDVKDKNKEGSPLKGYIHGILSVTFSGDGNRLAAGSKDKTVRMWDVASGDAIGVPLVHDCKVVHVELNVDGSRVVSYDARGYGVVWDATNGQRVIESKNPAEWTSTLHRFRLARFQWDYGWSEKASNQITEQTDGTHKQVLASTRGVFQVGAIYFSKEHCYTIWPLCRLVN
ncbi:Vegetative incompatibility protein HET-E-1 [Gracilariopsis chorda]|uniref:Vegetative incompatibility protein HET-E-1 n=1 Tax=Gracilariopsis chorda TaxID=448386 RepID=A0A2V3IKX0_9FLOR|nr:Vegetative incompatibility protein HET-E-1 [Gracilariopsis chorda]|eukprot:PXF42698.1 Vegetative incompatibility protein HET-E-1 [Gracilariopsis chorda]